MSSLDSSSRAVNLNAGPSALPLSVLASAQAQMINFQGSGMSVMELSHRSSTFSSILNSAFSDLRRLLSIPPNYRILFVQGGATLQFAAIPWNLLGNKKKALYLVTGAWSKAAYDAAVPVCDAEIVASNEFTGHRSVPSPAEWRMPEQIDQYAYLHYCQNETVHGIALNPSNPNHFPTNFPISSLPIVADFSSSFCSEPIDITKFGMIYAGAQKNVGPAGLTIVIIREDLLKLPKRSDLPVMMNWQALEEKESMLNTPPCWSIYMTGLVIKWIANEIGGLAKMKQINQEKAKLLYDFLDSSSFYRALVQAPADRSNMNIVFTVAKEVAAPGESAKGKKGKKNPLVDALVKEAEARKPRPIVGLAGHRSVGGLRASLYNAVTKEDVIELIRFLEQFQKKHEPNSLKSAL